MVCKEDILVELEKQFSEMILEISEPYGFLTLEVKKEKVKELIFFLKDTLHFEFLTDICGIHYPENTEKELGVIYHLHHLKANFRIRLQTFFSKKEAEVESITDLFAGANWMERETYDFYGIKFKGHPNLKVILNSENLGYFPMLKEYHLEDNTRTDKNDKMFGR